MGKEPRVDPTDNIVDMGAWAANELQGLRTQVERLEAQLEDRDLELLSTRAALRAYRAFTDTDALADPPAELVHALRSGSSVHQPVWIETEEGDPMLVLAEPAGRRAWRASGRSGGVSAERLSRTDDPD